MQYAWLSNWLLAQPGLGGRFKWETESHAVSHLAATEALALSAARGSKSKGAKPGKNFPVPAEPVALPITIDASAALLETELELVER